MTVHLTDHDTAVDILPRNDERWFAIVFGVRKGCGSL